MAPGVTKTFIKELKRNIANALEDYTGTDYDEFVAEVIADLAEEDYHFVLTGELTVADDYIKKDDVTLNSAEMIAKRIAASIGEEENVAMAVTRGYQRAYKATNRQTYQAMEGFVHNLNTMHSRAGAQVPFTSINYGTDTSPEGRMVMRNLLLATEAGLGNGETPIFPIHIFKLKEGVSYNPKDPNYDLFELACKVSAKRLFPNFSFLDSPFNKQYYKEGHPETEATYMG